MIAICYVYLSSFRAASAGHNRKESVFWHKGWLRRFTQFRQNATRINNGTNWYSKPFNSVLCNRLIWNLSKDLRILWNIIEKLHKKWSFPLRISSVNVTKSAVSCGFGHIDTVYVWSLFSIMHERIKFWIFNFSWRRSSLYRNQSIDLQSNSMDLFLYDTDQES